MTPQELQKLIDEKDFTQIAINLYKLTSKIKHLEAIEKTLSIYDEIPKLSSWTKKGSGYWGFPNARFYLTVCLASYHDYDYLYSKGQRIGLTIKPKYDVRKGYLDTIKLIFG